MHALSRERQLWAGESDRPCDRCQHRTNRNFALQQQPDGQWVCVVCILAARHPFHMSKGEMPCTR